jgi:hypothetical protein
MVKGQRAPKADNLTAICEPIVQKMWEPRRLTILWTSTVSYRDSFLRFSLNMSRSVPKLQFYTVLFLVWLYLCNSVHSSSFQLLPKLLRIQRRLTSVVGTWDKFHVFRAHCVPYVQELSCAAGGLVVARDMP